MLELSYLLGLKVNLGEQYLKTIEHLVQYYEFGSFIVPQAIIDQLPFLSDEQDAVMHEQLDKLHRVLVPLVDSSFLADYILASYERWDGKGYLHGLSGEQIPVESRVLALVSAFTIKTHQKIAGYQISFEQALKEIKKDAGKQFDPELADNLTAIFYE